MPYALIKVMVYTAVKTYQTYWFLGTWIQELRISYISLQVNFISVNKKKKNLPSQLNNYILFHPFSFMDNLA